jgi:3-hydroxyisobutyrate dehydrogenase-like beta-hydroxyacid dehydrogenase
MADIAPSPLRIGFVGAGQMGMPMVRRLVAAGHEVAVHARRPEARAACEAVGARATDDLTAAVTGADAVVVCVFSDTQLREVALRPDGILAAMGPGSLLVIHTTGSPATAPLLAERGADLRIRVVEAPVSGSATDIDEGRVTVLLGGAPEDLAAARAVVGAYGDPIFEVGELGTAQAVKLLNNALFAGNLQLVAEVERLAGELGVDWAKAAAVFQRSSGTSRALEIVASMGSVQSLVGAAGHFLVKDVTEVVATAATLGIDLGQLEAVNEHGPLHFLVAAPPSAAVDQDPREIEAIKQLKARYSRLLDTKDWDGFAELFTDDCEHVLPTSDGRPPVPTAEYVAELRRTLADAVTVHHGHTPEITITVPGEAEGTWAVLDDVELAGADGRPVRLRSYGFRHERYRKGFDGRWRISAERVDRLRVDVVETGEPDGR